MEIITSARNACPNLVDADVLRIGDFGLQPCLDHGKRQKEWHVDLAVGCSWSVVHLDLLRTREIHPLFYSRSFVRQVQRSHYDADVSRKWRILFEAITLSDGWRKEEQSGKALGVSMVSEVEGAVCCRLGHLRFVSVSPIYEKVKEPFSRGKRTVTAANLYSPTPPPLSSAPCVRFL